jgi:hypothetical protein
MKDNEMNIEEEISVDKRQDCDIQIENLIVDINQINNGSPIDELLDNLNINNENLIEVDKVQENLVEIGENEEKVVDIDKVKENEKLIEIDEPVLIVENIKFIDSSNRELDELKSKLNEFSDDQKVLGIIAPKWIPDSEVNDCMKCNSKFTFTKRRHHCRGCGLLFCATCCHLRIILQYSPKYESRVCQVCFEVIEKSKFFV